MKRSQIILILSFISFTGFGQYSYFTRNYYVNPILINPATTAFDYHSNLTISHKKQYFGIENSPGTSYLCGQMRIGKFDFYDPRQFINETKFTSLERAGLGGGIYYDKNGPISQLLVNVAYAYHLPLNEDMQLSFGISGNVIHHYLNSSELEPLYLSDPLLSNDNEKHTNFNFDLGTLLSGEKYFIGISVKNVLPTNKGLDEVREKTPDLYALAGIRYGKNPNKLGFETSTVVKKEIRDERVLVDIHQKVIFGSVSWISISYRDFNAIEFMAVINVYKSLNIGYSYEFTVGKIQQYNYGTHGIYAGVRF